MATVQATMAGIVLRVLAQPGQRVEAGQDVVVLESMKMEIPIPAEQAGVVAEVLVNEGDFVNEGDDLVRLES
ncbi:MULTISPECIES: acetyl-CoA carboxylase biotin carboxyl carrier protein subunit [Alicyclobacillus]|uniref:acetyl-CoA carboxylase biotin carboxyl carrier protein subunit n=1 Tax=Alicyclobacillus TaxID=29330 RepID=UPI000835999E|nr:acetyl-CoA carboxylase biotin carboxyl carrier protein subunit [Alicyclobacillus mali (ex Roth et al. 2021)]